MFDRTKSGTTSTEKRRAPRIATSNFLGYVCLDEDESEISEGYGWTVNLSKTGIRMETFRAVETQMVLLLAIDLDDRLLEIKGEIVYSHKNEEGRYICGVQFADSEEKQRTMISSFVKSYYVRDKKLIGPIG
jgi:c-di-GMP-binding flagellar brake protein YcgR